MAGIDIAKVYKIRLNNKVKLVKVIGASPHGGYIVRNMVNGKRLRLRTTNKIVN